MKFPAIFIFFLLCCASTSLAQRGKSIRVKAGDDIAQAYSPIGFYRFIQFGKATLYYRSGTKYENSALNYNFLSANMQFISPKNDTLDLAQPEALDSVVFDNAVFVWNNGFMEVVSAKDSLRLLKKTIIKTQTENIGAYGTSNTTGAIENINKLHTGIGVYNLVLNQDVVVDETINWFFSKGNSKPVKASRSNFLELLGAETKSKTEAWLKQHKTSFDREADLKNLLASTAE